MKNLKDTINSLLDEAKNNYECQKELKKQKEEEEKENKIKRIKVKNLDEEEYFKKLDDKNKELLELLGNALFYSQKLSKNEAKNFEKIMKI